LAVAAVAADLVHRCPVAVVDRAAVLVDSLVRRQVLVLLVRATMAARLAPLHPRFVVLVVVARLRSALTAMRAVAQAVLDTPTTVRHTLAVVVVVQRRAEALHLADQALVVMVAVLPRQLASTEQ
jgi:hypothetical protein